MLTPLRFRDSDDPLARELLASADQDRPPSVSRARVAQGLGLGPLATNAPPAPPGAPKGTPSAVLRLGALQKYLLVGLATGLTAVAGWRLTAPARPDGLQQSPQVLASAAREAEPPAPLPSTAALEPTAVEPAVTPSEAARPTPLRSPAPAAAARMPARRSAAPTRAPLQGDTLLAQVAQLDRARAALRDQHPAQAISDLDVYAATFPNAELALEAEVLRVHALLAAREPSAAAALAGRLLDRPGSERYREELRRVIAGTRR